MQIESLLQDPKIIALINQLSQSSILVTGATGMVGSQLIRLLMYANQKYATKIQIIGHARNSRKVNAIFGNELLNKSLSFIYGDIGTDRIEFDNHVDYIVHAAAPTASQDFIKQPVEVIQAILHGTENVLQFAKKNQVRKVVYLSTMEVYGISSDDRKRDEYDYDILDHLAIRSSYPESKKMAESMCVAWSHEKHVPVCIARLTQTFGFGVPYQDQRVFAEFARCAVEKRDIILHSSGETRRNYLFIGDALSAILSLLLKGSPGEAYNVANDEIYISILEMAQLVVNHFGQNGIQVYINQEAKAEEMGYAPPLRMNLSTAKLRALGWQPNVGLLIMYESMIEYWALSDCVGILNRHKN
jgi:nucleoside-diphosphate-sugar epimerase